MEKGEAIRYDQKKRGPRARRRKGKRGSFSGTLEKDHGESPMWSKRWTITESEKKEREAGPRKKAKKCENRTRGFGGRRVDPPVFPEKRGSEWSKKTFPASSGRSHDLSSRGKTG